MNLGWGWFGWDDYFAREGTRHTLEWVEEGVSDEAELGEGGRYEMRYTSRAFWAASGIATIWGIFSICIAGNALTHRVRLGDWIAVGIFGLVTVAMLALIWHMKMRVVTFDDFELAERTWLGEWRRVKWDDVTGIDWRWWALDYVVHGRNGERVVAGGSLMHGDRSFRQHLKRIQFLRRRARANADR